MRDAFWARTYSAVLERNRGDPRLGRKLYRMFLEAGVPGTRMRMAQEVHAERERKVLPLLTLEATATSITEAGLASTEEVESALASLSAFTDDPTSLVAGPRIFQVWAHRPESST